MKRWCRAEIGFALVAVAIVCAAPTPVAGQVPVLLVPGWFDTDRDLAALRIRLLGAGWAVTDVETVAFEEPTGGNRQHAAEIRAAVEGLMERTGASEIDIVAHSMGGLATRWYLLQEEDPPVRRVAFIASPHHGTLTAYLAWGEGRDDMKPDSPFLQELNAAPPVPEGIEAITIRTPLDTHVIPNDSGILDGVPDHSVCCPTHAGMLRSMDVFTILRRFLEFGTERP